MSKVCKKCNLVFDGVRCKECKKKYDKGRYAINSEEIIHRASQHYKDNREEKLNYQKQYYLENQQKRIEYADHYRSNNWDSIYAKKKHRRNIDIEHRLSENLRNRIRDALTGRRKSGSAVHDLGCSIEDLKIWLERQFQPGMSWDNYGFYGWHIDHVIPLVTFDLTDRKQFLEACHYTNLQPMWAKNNLSKGSKTF